ncbi:hypothetical protein J2802_004452 [Paraburkholderia caribensis]|nr:hypothetical protein [Paraburkholderia caribensis]
MDTGASETLLSRSLMRRLGVALTSAAPGLDHVGINVRTWTCIGNVSLEVGRYRRTIPDVAVIDMPTEFEWAGVGGVLCPQRLHADATLRLDLSGARIELFDDAATCVAPDRGCGDGLVPITLPRKRVEGEISDLIVVEGVFDAMPTTSILLNTGARESEVAYEGSIQRASRTKRWVRGFGGAGVSVRIVDVSLSIGSVAMQMQGIVARPQPHGFGGQLGMEILGRTCLEMRNADDTIRWWIPPDWRQKGV